jgi:predicted mannosyl-3-phosphoglycerate phosphatase (HAD superfamily)
MTSKLRDVKKLLASKSKEAADLKKKFKSFRQRKPDHALTREFKGLHDKQDAVASSEEMSSLIAKFSL